MGKLLWENLVEYNNNYEYWKTESTKIYENSQDTGHCSWSAITDSMKIECKIIVCILFLAEKFFTSIDEVSGPRKSST